MSEDLDFDSDNLEQKIKKYFNSEEIQSLVLDANKKNLSRITLDLNHMRESEPTLTKMLLKNPLKIIPIMEKNLNEISQNLKGEKSQQVKNTIQNKKEEQIHINFQGMLGTHLVSPRGLTAELTNQYVGVQGIVTRISEVRPKLVYSVHYCEETKHGNVKEYNDQMKIAESSSTYGQPLNGNFESGNASGFMNNAIPTRDINHNPLTFEYGFSKFKDQQVILLQEPPERTPLGQLPRSVEVVLEGDLVDKVKPGDRIQVNGIFKCISTLATSSSGNVKTVLIGTNVQIINNDIQQNEYTGEDLRRIRELAKKKEVFNILANSIAPGIYGHQDIKKALVLQLLGGNETNLDDGTHLRGDINILMIGDPSTAKSQFLRYMLNVAPNAINTTGKGSSGVGLTAAVMVDRDTGDRHLEAGAMVLGDRGIVCIDEFDKMNELDRVAIHEVMEQQTVTIAKAGIHVSLNARCSVLAAANPIYGQYIQDMSASRNIGFPDSLLSRFDLCFIVLDEHNSELDRRISERVIDNHMYTIDASKFGDDSEDKVIEPEINMDENKKTVMYEKSNPNSNGRKDDKNILTREFLRKYIYYAKSKIIPQLTKESTEFISKSWGKLREKSISDEWKGKSMPITVRTLESLIRIATAFAKARLSQKVERQDCENALDLLASSFFQDNEAGEDDDEDNRMDLIEEEGDNQRKKSKRGKNADRSIPLQEEDDEPIEDKRKRGRKHREKKSNEEKEVEELVEAQIDEGDDDEDEAANDNDKDDKITDQHANMIFKFIYEYAKKKKNQTIDIDELWSLIKDKKECKDKKITKKNKLLDICAKLEDEGKIFVSETKEIALV
ncbi:MAG: ATP-binding protein [Clostridia bacterium]|nr:ATP-binding protein [Clostridia bacterium]